MMAVAEKGMDSVCAGRIEILTNGANISGHPYSISVLKEGYCLSQSDGSTRADGTISLLRGPKTILVDTGGPWDREFLLVTLIVGCDISQGDLYLPNQLAEGKPYPIDEHVSVLPTPGHTGRDVSVLVKGTSMGTVLVAGDLFESCSDEDTWRDLSENPAVQEVNRKKALQIADRH
ncbi:hypothetical protein GJAV_G00197700 [Gymnothorax javanicus]|nr:hypothetical protein GJAV_G00197700 [Gymnothorax javanicus]